MSDYRLRFIELKLARKELMLKCLNDFYEMHLDLAQDDDVSGFEGEQQFSKECYGYAHTMIKRLKEDSILDLDTNFKCNIANISIDHYLDEEHSPTRCRVVKRIQRKIQEIWGV